MTSQRTLSAVNWDSEGQKIGHPEYSGREFRTTSKQFYLILIVEGIVPLLKSALIVIATKPYHAAAMDWVYIFPAFRTMVCAFFDDKVLKLWPLIRFVIKYHSNLNVLILSLSDTCKVMEHNNFLKLVCNDVNGKQYFKCLNSDSYYSVEAALPGWSKFSKLCENDPKFYQVCGAGHDENFRGSNIDVLCGQYVCEDEKGVYTSGYTAESSYSCDGQKQCKNTNLDEADCDGDLSTTFPASRVCDGYCDKLNCEDESICNGYSYGMKCGGTYFPSNLVGFRTAPDGSAYLIDYEGCVEDGANTNVLQECIFYNSHLIGWDDHRDRQEFKVKLVNFTRCGVFKYRQNVIDDAFWINSEYTPYCKNFTDQTNCTDSSRVAFNCTVKGYPSSVSRQVSTEYL